VKTLKGEVIVLTGATGFIGQHLLRRLSKEPGIRLVVVSRREVADLGENALLVRTPLEALTAGTWERAGVESVDILYHLAGFIPKSPGDANALEEVYRDNLDGTRVLLESFPAPLRRVVLASTADVYLAPAKNTVLSESSPLGPANLYAASKLFCEELVRQSCRGHGSSFAILRYGHIYGPGEEAYQKVIPQAIRAVLQGESPVVYGDGSAMRDFLYVDDAVEATLRAGSSREAELGPLNVVRGASEPISTIVESIARLAGFQGEIRYLLDKPPGTSLRFDSTRLRECLGDWDPVPLEEGLRREIEYFKSVGNEDRTGPGGKNLKLVSERPA
jgi:nucleoside-diphosphate-sugar epimerase